MCVEEICASFSEISEIPSEHIERVGNPISIPIFSQETIFALCDIAIQKLKLRPTLIRLQSPIVVVGDIHGNLHDLLRILNDGGNPGTTQYLFLGDYVDRGQFSTETIIYLLDLFTRFTDNITLLRGNHEFPDVNGVYGFKDETLGIYRTEEVWEKINEVFNYMPIAATINDVLFCVHGGLSIGFSELKQIYELQRPITNDNIPLIIKKLLWADPCSSCHSFEKGDRGFGENFGNLALKNFYESTGMKGLVRGHQCQTYGFHVFAKTCLTVFSSSGYANHNHGAVALFNEKLDTNFFTYYPISIPSRDMCCFFHMKTIPNTRTCPLLTTYLPTTMQRMYKAFGNIRKEGRNSAHLRQHNAISRFVTQVSKDF